ncbi:MAG: asparagine synthase (glutamine-hydrolyzing) [Lachnospiraceae bacterium]|nr:asparagine synthase (glutamine-hydrolyzing) [Lachnospiraceae bacterium]
MCGIFGVINQNIDRGLAERCLNTLIHRGPDDWGLKQEEGVTLGHRRLSILDLSEKGRQPMSSKDGRYELVFNGEIYNFLELRRALEQKGYQFESESDSEVLLAAYDHYKEKCLDRFNGMWAFAIWDRREKRLFLSRDRFGVKPLYYTRLSGGGFAFASEMKALFPLMDEVRPNRRLVCDPERIVYYESTEECVIGGILRFPAGSYGYVDGTGLRIEGFWDTLRNLVRPADTYEGQVEEFRELFFDAIRLRMRSDVTIGTALSGGLDSSATICAMAHLAGNRQGQEVSKTAFADSAAGNTPGGALLRVNRDWQHAYVATFPGTALDESVYAKKVTDYLGIRSTFVEIDPGKAVDQLDEMVYLFEDVYLTSPIPMMLLYRALKQDGTVVTIDGHRADELFGGYTFDFINALKDAGSKAERDMVLTAYVDSFPKDGSNTALRSNSKNAVYMNFLKRQLKDRLKAGKQGYKRVRAQGDPAYESMDTLNQILYASSHETILPTLLRNYDRYSMASGVEIRMPFLDYRVVSYAMSLSWRSKLHGGYSKSIIRDAMSPFMPKEITYRKTKIGFNTPIVEWMKGPLREYFTDLTDSQDFRNCDLIRPGETRDAVMKVINDPAASFADGEKAFSMLYPYLWEKNVIRHREAV